MHETMKAMMKLCSGVHFRDQLASAKNVDIWAEKLLFQLLIAATGALADIYSSPTVLQAQDLKVLID